MAITYRIASEKDVPFITDVYNQNVPKRTVTADLTPRSTQDELQALEQHNAKRPMWIIWSGDQRVGYVSLESFYGRPAYHSTVEISIYIDDKFQHQGIGSHTMKFIANQVKILHLHTVLAFVFSVNVPSQKLFKAFGYTKYGHLPKVADMGNRIISLDILGKKY